MEAKETGTYAEGTGAEKETIEKNGCEKSIAGIGVSDDTKEKCGESMELVRELHFLLEL